MLKPKLYSTSLKPMIQKIVYRNLTLRMLHKNTGSTVKPRAMNL